DRCVPGHFDSRQPEFGARLKVLPHRERKCNEDGMPKHRGQQRALRLACSGEPPGGRADLTLAEVGLRLWFFGGLRAAQERSETAPEVLPARLPLDGELRIAESPAGHALEIEQHREFIIPLALDDEGNGAARAWYHSTESRPYAARAKR